jgi:gluconate 2-dehydrogenase gamma chain
MFKKPEQDNEADRRAFLKLVGAMGTAGALPFAGAASGAERTPVPDRAVHDHALRSAASRTASVAYQFFNVNEAAFIEAAVDTLIPADALGPGALEADVATYIDRQMSGGFGKGDRMYLQGPFGEGLPQQGYQSAMTPSELIRTGIADVNGHTQRRFGKMFDSLSNAERATVLAELDSRKVELPNVPVGTFFDLLLQLTIEGYFADPLYGGNTNKAAWKMIGFPGASAMYADKIESFRNKPYTAEPLGIQDLA